MEFTIFNLLAGLSGLAWTVCYIQIIWKGFKDKVCCMPLYALALNFVWEFIFGFIWDPTGWADIWQTWINSIWCVFDVLILITHFMYGEVRGVPKNLFRAYSAFVIAFTFGIFGALYYAADGEAGIKCLHEITSVGVNVPMSALFITSFLWLRGTIGQSMGIAWSKFLGTGVITVGFTFIPGAADHIGTHYPVILAAGWTCFALDLFYIYDLRKAIRT